MNRKSNEWISLHFDFNSKSISDNRANKVPSKNNIEHQNAKPVFKKKFNPKAVKDNVYNNFVESSNVSKLCDKNNSSNDESISFIDKLKPKVVQDLAVHAKKIKEVEIWLEQNVLHSFRPGLPRMLLLTGPTGSGKTATLITLCKSMGINLAEWDNPHDLEYDYNSKFKQSQTRSFLEFMSEVKYPSLLENSNYETVALIKDFPNFVIHNPSDFLSVLEICDKSNPIIFICSDTASSNLNLQNKIFTNELKQQYSMTTINFNSCSVTLLKQLLKNAMELINNNPSRYHKPSNEMIEAIIFSAAGDIRCAINQFNFASVKGVQSLALEPVFQKQSKKRKRNEKKSSIKSMLKDEYLGIFHGLGRVLNPKRVEIDNKMEIQCNFDSLIDEFSGQPSIFISLLQENYLKYFINFEDIVQAADNLSMAQIFLDDWSDGYNNTTYSLWTSVLGTMVSNKNPASKWNQIQPTTKYKQQINSRIGIQKYDCTERYFYNLITKTETFPSLKQFTQKY